LLCAINTSSLVSVSNSVFAGRRAGKETWSAIELNLLEFLIGGEEKELQRIPAIWGTSGNVKMDMVDPWSAGNNV